MTNNRISGFAALNVAPEYCQMLKRLNIETPTPIQEKAIPIALAGNDLIGIAQTGTGKTLAFALPMMARLRPNQAGLVLAPTRELAQQIAETYQKLNVPAVLIVGGAGMNRQVQQLRSRYSVIVATPGRLTDHLHQGTLKLNRISIVVLDEADRMLDMGFAPAIKRILAQTPKERQTLLFSATMPKEITEIASQYLQDPHRVEIAKSGTASELVEHELFFVPQADKQPLLADLLDENRGSVLVFARTRYGAKKLARVVRMEGHSAAELHSDRTLNQRREALNGFKSGQYRVLVATDIAARGIDVHEISLVINFDVPEKPEDYVHRIGRTGRAGAQGRAITIAHPEQAKDVRDIERLLGSEIPVSDRSTARPNRSAHPRPVKKHETERVTKSAAEVITRPESRKQANPSSRQRTFGYASGPSRRPGQAWSSGKPRRRRSR